MTAAATEAGGLDGLPSIPLDDDVSGKASSELPPGGKPPAVSVLGKDYILMERCTVDGDALVLNGDTLGDDPASTPAPAYALYKLPNIPLEMRALSLNIECVPGGLAQHYFVGVADYTDLKWKWFGPVTLPEFQLDLRGHNHQFLTHLGNMYFILVCPPGNSARHLQTTALLGPRDPGWLPGGPHGLVATDGQLAEAVGLTWVEGASATHYQVFRKLARAGAQWKMIGETDSTSYTDQPLPDYVMFYYRVRAVSSNGPSGFSNVDSGFAGGGDDPCIVRGTVLAADGRPLPGVKVALAGMGEEAVRITDLEGKFHFRNLAPGRYLVVPFKPAWDFHPAYSIADVRQTKLAELSFTGAPEAPFHRIWGFAYEFTGSDGNPPLFTPMAGLTIEARLAGSPETVMTAVTNEDGFYHFEDLPEGTYLVRAVKEGYAFFPPAHEVVINGHNRPDRRDFLGFPKPPDDPNGGGV